MVRDSNQENVRFFDSDLDRQMKTNYVYNQLETNMVRNNNLVEGANQTITKTVVNNTLNKVVQTPGKVISKTVETTRKIM